MLIKKIKARNFKTYLNLDLDISVESDAPIILIGGVNGGGKTTLFEAIYGALYGLQIHTPKYFKELLNAGALGKEDEKIVLELYFTGKVLNEEQHYVLTRTYALNPSGNPVESVKLNMNGTIFLYGTATPPAQRAEQEAQVSKIIKANLPQELSRYFLFDAMEAGNLLKEDQLNRVIKENIENVMGFNKYMQLAKAAESLYQTYTAQRLQVENEKKEYLELIEQKRGKEEELDKLKLQHQDALHYSVSGKELYDNLKSGLNQETTIKSKIDQTKAQIDNIHKKEEIFRNELEANIKKYEILIAEMVGEISKIGKRLHQFDIQISQEPDPKYEALGKLKPFFEDVANHLLKMKKQQIELKMKQDLNINLTAYLDVIDRVELSENLSNLTFKIYHKSGNEVYLNHLNTASKQIVVQVLLKSLHEFGDYNPPVMIDTVMGVLDESSRATVLENYFPELSHQTLLLSSDSEIRPGKDFEKIEPFISKVFTLKRDREKQLTEVVPGYFGKTLNN